ncbi:MAG: orotate phosphoribosyltransferase [Actinomycetota bacterium]
MTENEVLEALRQVGAISNGHFVLSSGRHSDTYAEKFRALENPELAVRLGAAIAERFAAGSPAGSIDVVLAPAIGGIILGFVTALALGVRSIFAERENGTLSLRRGFHIGASENVLVVEDVVTTGKSLKEVVDLVEPNSLVGIACLVDRSTGIDLPLPLNHLAQLKAESWAPDDCPLCSAGLPTDSPGSRHLG